jgi:arsenate reductase
VEYDSIDYYKQKISKQELTNLIKKLKIEPKELLRKKAVIYSELGLKNKDLNLSEVVKLILQFPDLLQRPIVVRGDEVILARPAENIKSLID